MPESSEKLKTEVTRLRRELKGMRRARDAAELSSGAKTRFVSHISHELRTPMNGILGMTRLALETELNREQREYLEVIQSSADSLLTLVNDLLDEAKIDAGQLELEAIPFRIEDTVRNTLRALEVIFDHKGLKLETTIGDEVPRTLVGDPTRLRQVLVNLVGNAAKFTDEGGTSVAVELHEQRAAESLVQFSVTDTGIGIPDDRKAMIFDAFQQADNSTTRKYGGTGLGLSISKRLITLMGGTLDVDSEVGVGSTFHFTIPLGTRAERDYHPETEATELAGGVAVLVLSDGPVNRDTLIEVITEGEMQPRIVEEPAKAIDALNRVRATGANYGLIILDLQSSGLETAWEIRRETSEIPIVLVTPSGQRGDAARCRDLDIGGYLTGPVLATDLKDTIQAVLGGSPELITRYWLREHRKSLRVLVADDSGTNRLLAARLLEKRGHLVIGVANGAEAVAAIEQREFDVVLMDVHMPEMDGYEATRQIRHLPGNRSSTPVIALTGSVNDEGRRKCLDAGMDRFIAKPFKVEDLLSAIEDLTLNRPI